MPLPDVQTLQNSDTIDAQQNPAFMTDPITSPNTTVGVPVAPQPAPTPQVGTGQNTTQTNNSPIRDEFLNGLFKADSLNKTTPGNLSKINNLEAQTDVERYPKFNIGENNEEMYGVNQSALSQWGHALVKSGIEFSTGLAEGLMTIPATVEAIANNNFSDAYNGPIRQSMDKWKTSMDNALPNYETNAGKTQNPLLAAIPGVSQSFANFWGDKVLKNVAGVAGTIASSIVQDAVIGAVTEGIGASALVPEQFANIALKLNKIFATAGQGDRVLTDAVRLGATGESLLDLQKVIIGSNAKKFANTAEYLTNLYTSGATMAAAGARSEYNDLKQSFIDDYTNDHGYGPSGEELADIEKKATQGGNARFAIDTSVMMLTSARLFDNLLKGFGSRSKGFINSVQKTFGEDLEGIGFKEGGDIGEVGYTGKAARVKQAFKGINTDSFKSGAASVVDNAKVAGSRIANAIPTLGQASNYLKGNIGHALTAGLAGSSMIASQEGVKNFYSDLYNDRIKGTLWDAVTSFGKGLGAQFGSREGGESFLIGAIMGSMLGPAAKRLEKLRSGYDATDFRNKVIDTVNKEKVSGFMKNNMETAASSLGTAERMQAANEAGDVFAFDNLKHNELVNFVLNHARNNMHDIGIEKLRLMKDLPPEQFIKLFQGMEDTPANREIANKYVDNLIDEAQSIKKSYDLINETFGNPYKRTINPRTEEELTNNLKADTYEHYKATLTKYATVSNNVARRMQSVRADISDVHAGVTAEDLSTITNPFKLNEYNKELKAKAKGLQDTLESNGSADPKADRQHLNHINELTGEVDRLLSSKAEAIANGDTSFEQVYGDIKDLSTFEKLANYKANGENYVPNSENNVPPEALAHLATYGGEMNKLEILRRQSRDTYEALTSKRGFNKFFNADQAARAAQQDPADFKTENNPTGTLNPDQFTVNNPTTGKDHVFTNGQETFINQKKGNPLKATIIGRNQDGSISVQYADGSQAVVRPEDLFASSERVKTTTETNDVNNTPPPPPAPEPSETKPTTISGTPSNDAKPDIRTGLRSTSDPRYNDPNLYDQSTENGVTITAHQRHMNFLFDLGSSDPKVFNQNSRSSLKIQPVTVLTQEEFGFPKGWIENTGGNSLAIRGVYVLDTPNGKFYSDSKGNPLGKVGETINPSDAIYTNFRTTDLVNGKGIEKYHDLKSYTPEQIKSLQDEWEARRRYWLAQREASKLTPEKFTVSNGLAVFKTGLRNSVSEAGVAIEKDFYNPNLVAVSKLGEIVANPILDEGSDRGIGTTRESQALGKGSAKLNIGGNLVWLNNANITEEVADRIVRLLTHYSDADVDQNEANDAFEAIKSLVYTRRQTDEKEPLEKHGTSLGVTLAGTVILGGRAENKDNIIHLNPESIAEHADEIKKFLMEKAYHNIDNRELKAMSKNAKMPENLKYYERDVVDGKLQNIREWPTYNHYLLSDEGNRQPILTTNLVSTEDGTKIRDKGKRPIIQKFSTLENFEFKDVPLPATAPTKNAAPKPTREVTPSKTAATPTKAPESTPATPKDQRVIHTREFPITPSNPADGVKVWEYFPILDENGEEIGIDEPVGIRMGSATAELKPVSNVAGFKTVMQGIIDAEVAARPKKDVTTAKPADTSFLDRKDIVLPPDAQTRYLPAYPSNFAKISEKELAETRRLAGDTPVHEVENALKMTNGGRAFGAFANNAIYIWRNGPEGTGYHEAFERVYNTFLSGKEQQELHDEFTNREGTFKNFRGEEKSYSKADFKEAKEQMAEEFAEYKLNPKNDLPPKRKSFFRRLIDFIKKVLFGDRDKINNLFEKINKGEFGNRRPEPDATLEPQYREDGLAAQSEAFKQDLNQGLTAEMFSMLFGEDKTIVEQFEKGDKKSAKDAYGNLYTHLRNYHEGDPEKPDDVPYVQALYNDIFKRNPNSRADIEADYMATMDSWNYVKQNWPEVVKAHTEYLKTFNIKFTVNEEGTLDLDDIETLIDETERAPGDYAPDAMSYDVKKSTSNIVRLMYNTIGHSAWDENGNPRINREVSLVKLPKLTDGSKLMNYTFHQMANLNGLADMLPKIMQMAKDTSKLINADFSKVFYRLKPENGFAGKSIPDAKLLLTWENNFVKQKIVPIRQSVDADGKTYHRSNILNTKARILKNEWTNDIKASDLVSVSGKKVKFLKPNPKLTYIQFAKTLGINLDSKNFGNLSESIKNQFKAELSTIRGIITGFAESGKKFNLLSSETMDFDSTLGRIADLYVENVLGDDTENSRLNLDNKRASAFILPNAVSTPLNDINNAKDKASFLAKHPEYNDIFHNDSIILHRKAFSATLNKDGLYEHKSPIAIRVAEGRQQLNGKSIPADKLSPAERVLYQFNNDLRGVSYTLVPGDGKNEFGVEYGLFFDADSFFKEGGAVGAIAQFNNMMYSYLKTEVALAKDYATNPNRRNIEILGFKLDDRVRGNSLRIFKDFLPEDIVNNINKDVIDGGKPLSDVISEDNLLSISRAILSANARNTLDTLTRGKIFEKRNGNYKLNGVEQNFLLKAKLASETVPEIQALKLMTFREMNYIISNIEHLKMFFGDPAMYKSGDILKRVKSFLSPQEYMHVDNLGEKGFNSNTAVLLNMAHKEIPLDTDDPGYHQFKNYANTLTLHDVEVESRSMPMLRSELGDKMAKPYEETNEADAQALAHASYYREMYYKSGARFTDAQEREYQRYFAHERLDKEKLGTYKYRNSKLKAADEAVMAKQPFADPNVTFPIVKPKAAGLMSVNGVTTPFLDKFSLAPNFYEWVKGTQNEHIYNAMSDGSIDYVIFTSGRKMGRTAESSLPLYNDDGTVNTEGIRNATALEIPHSLWGIQVETLGSKTKNTEGTQLKTIDTLNFYSEGVPKDFTGDRKEWDELSESEKRSRSELHGLAQDVKTIKKELAIKRTSNLLQQWGVKENEDGSIDIPDKTKIAKFIQSELTRREMPANIKKGLTIDPVTKDWAGPLEGNIRAKEIFQLMNSKLDKTVLRPAINGGPKIQRAVTGFEKGPRIHATNINGKKVMVSNNLKFYAIGEDGKTQACQVYLPYHFGAEVRKKLQETHDFKTDEEFHNHLMNYLNKTKEGRELLTGIGFRIPLQGLNSVELFEVKGFLHPSQGDMIVLPSEITAKAGSDFDVDKLNTYMYNFYVNEQGYPKKIKFTNYNTNDEASLTDAYERLHKDDREKWEAYQRDPARFANEALDQELEEDNAPDYVPTLSEFLESAKGGNKYQLNSLKALENKYIDALRAIVEHPLVRKDLLTPNNADQVKELSKGIVSLSGGLSKKEYSNLINSGFMANERHVLVTSKKALGIAASTQTAHAIGQAANYSYDPRPYEIVNLFHKDQLNSLSRVNNINGNSISNIISQVIDGSADATKDKFLANMNLTQKNAPIWLLMFRTGEDEEIIALFNNQPAILEYQRLKQIHNSVGAINKKVQSMWPDDIFKLVGKKIGVSGSRKKIRAVKGFITKAEMKDAIRAAASNHKIEAKDALKQMQMLDYYMKIETLSKDLFKSQQGFNWGTDRMGDSNMIRRKEFLLTQANSLNITPANEILKNSHIGEYRQQLLRIDNAIRATQKVESERGSDILDAYAQELLPRYGLTDEDFKGLMQKIKIAMLDHTAQTQSKVGSGSLSSYHKSIMTTFSTQIGDKMVKNISAAMYLDGMKNLPVTGENMVIINNPFVSAVNANIDPREGYRHTIELATKDFDTSTSNRITAGLKELSTMATPLIYGKRPSDIYERFVLAGILQNGSQVTSTSWSHLIPNEDYGKYVNSAMDKMDSALEGFKENYIPYRNLWDNDKLVPPVPDLILEHPEDPSQTYIGSHEYTDSVFKAKLGKENSLIQLDTFQYRDKPVVKLVSYVRDKDGKVVDKITRLYRKFVGPLKDGASVYKDEIGAFGTYSRPMILFTEINKWNNEYYTDNVQSAYTTNPYVEEVTDAEIERALVQAKEQIAKDFIESLDELATEVQEFPASDENSDDVSETSAEDPNIIKNLEDKGIIKKKNCD